MGGRAALATWHMLQAGYEEGEANSFGGWFWMVWGLVLGGFGWFGGGLGWEVQGGGQVFVS